MTKRPNAKNRRPKRPAPEQRREVRRRSTAEVARETILAAAATVFSRKGYYGGTIEDVAREAGYSPAALYKHFSSRDEIFSELWTRVAGELEGLFTRAVSQQGRFETRLRWLVQELARLLEASPNVLIAFLSQRPYTTKGKRSELESAALAHYRRHMAQITALMESGIREGAVRKGSAEAASLLFVGLLYEFAYRWLTSEEPFDLSVDVDLLIDLFKRGVGVQERSNR